jgi:hypothetical protein
MNRYNNGKIYKLVNSVDDKIYIGSTCLSLAKSISNHRTMARRKPLPCHQYLNDIGWDKVRIILIESVTAETKDQLLMREQHYIDLLKPELNKQSAYVNCPHGRQHQICKDCGGSSICEHGRQHQICKDCGGSSICEHGRQHQICKDCGGSSICKHNRIRSTCKDCGGSSICSHGKRKLQCKDCNNDKYYCYECEIAFGSINGLKYHENSKKHKDTYDRMFNEVFGSDSD